MRIGVGRRYMVCLVISVCHCAALAGVGVAACAPTRWAPPAAVVGGDTQTPDQTDKDTRHDRARGWFMDVGVNQYWPRLSWSEPLLGHKIGVPNRHLFPGQYRNITTFEDARDAGTLIMPVVGIGRSINDRLALLAYVMAGRRTIDNSQRFSGIFTLDADFKADLWAVGLRASIYPFGRADPCDTGSALDLLRASRPSIDQAIEVEYLDGHGVGDFRLLGIPVSRTTRSLADWNVSYNPGLGWEIPIDQRTSLIVGGSYHFHAYMPEELNGWNISLLLRISF